MVDAIYQKGQHAIVFGDRGVGKTSLANVLASFLPAGGRIIAPRINCDSADTFDSLWRKVFQEIQERQQTVVGGFSGLSMRPRADAIDEPISPEIIRRQLAMSSIGATPVLILDEFDRLDSQVKVFFADTIKTLSDHAVPATVVLVGVADSVDQLITEHHSIERALVQVKMPRMINEEIFQIIQNGLSRLEMTIEDSALSRIAVLAQGLPHYAHLLGLHSARTALQALSSHINNDIVDGAIRKALDNAQQSVRTAWHNAILSQRKDNLFADVLLSCALATTDDAGWFAAQDVRPPMQVITGKPYDIPNFAQHLHEFSDEKRGNILKKWGAARRFRYRFTNPLMQPFVIMRGFADGKLTPETLERLEHGHLSF